MPIKQFFPDTAGYANTGQSVYNEKYPDRIFWYLFIALIVLQLFITLFTNGFALSQDEAMWHYIGRNWFRNGMVPYTGGADNKSPLFYTIFGISDLLFGVNYWFPRVFGTLVQSAGIFFLYRIAGQLAGKRAGLLAMSFYGLSVLWHGADGRYVSFTETYELTFVIISFYLSLSAKTIVRMFFCGVLLSVALMFRLSAFFAIVPLFIMAVRKGKTSAIAFSAGLVIAFFALILIGILAGIDPQAVYFYAIADNFGSGSTTDHDFLWRAVQFYNLFFYSEIILFYPLVLAYLFMQRKFDWLLIWLTSVFIGLNVIGNYARVDMKELLPAMALIGAIAVGYVIDTWQVSFKKVMFIVWICFSPRLIEPFVNVKRLFTGEFQFAENFCHEPFVPPDESASRQLGLWVKATTKPNDKVYVAGFGSQVQAYSERISPSIYFNVTQTPVAKQTIFNDLNKRHPELILVPLFPQYKEYVGTDLRNLVDSLTAKYYRFDRCMFNYDVYRLKKSGL
ncbi:hypothetical protein FO440_12655 [Mucilaginibacter corticis]|uniref:Glycosyltransferase RgtA/B/C/D-like domain-containing protein n=1 Tax=Mucilaginibacter corticis TaxID=2597670 RepID=A0A556MKZ5_9SPHI|nr:glycosyltransferase family 39 protein [Mucilaginibacter corticis]TSJ40594.1 hypothetical protein FO440_12655 [Mucilaginibacter corticis]